MFDLDGFSGGLQEMIAKIMDFNPDVVGIPIFTASLKDARIACQELRKRSTKINIIAGGPHPSACPEDTLILFPEVDFLLRGESDYTICKLIENLQNNTARPEIAGLSYRNGGSIVSHPVGVAPHNLDDIPIPDRKLLWDNYQKGVYFGA